MGAGPGWDHDTTLIFHPASERCRRLPELRCGGGHFHRAPVVPRTRRFDSLDVRIALHPAKWRGRRQRDRAGECVARSPRRDQVGVAELVGFVFRGDGGDVVLRAVVWSFSENRNGMPRSSRNLLATNPSGASMSPSPRVQGGRRAVPALLSTGRPHVAERGARLDQLGQQRRRHDRAPTITAGRRERGRCGAATQAGAEAATSTTLRSRGPARRSATGSVAAVAAPRPGQCIHRCFDRCRGHPGSPARRPAPGRAYTSRWRGLAPHP